MASSSSKVLVVVVSLCLYVCGIKGRPTNLKGDIATEDQQNFEESDLLKRSKTRSGGEQRGSKGRKKQVIDAFHLGPYHHGHPWGTVSHWPGFHWGGQPAYHGGWTGYPILGGWHRSRISKKDARTSEHRAALKRQVLPTFTFPTYGLAYPSLAFATVPYTPAIIPWGYGVYRSKVPDKTSKGQTRSSVKGSSADKRWWPGYMGGWGGWGIGNEGYPGWGPLGDFWGHGFDAAGLGHGWGVGFGDVFHPFLRSDVPRKQNKKGKAEKRWWPGYMGGWGGWGLGNTGYPGWGPLGSDFGHGLGYYGYGHGWGLYGLGHGFGPGYGQAGLADISGKKKSKEEKAPKRQFIEESYGGFGYPLNAYAQGFPYGPFGTFGSPFFGHGAYVPYPEALYGGYSPYEGFGPYSFENGFYKSQIPSKKSKKVTKKAEKDEEATSRHFVVNFNPGRYGWGGSIYPGHGYGGAFPLLGTFTYGGLYGGYYGPYGPPRVPFRTYQRSNVPDNSEENGQSRQVINYHPGCYGWGGCIYPGSGPIGGWTWPLPCHFRHHHHCVPCWTRSKYPKTQDIKEEKGKSRQEIADPGADEGEDSDTKDPQTRPHLEGADLLNSQMQNLAMGFPGVEKLQTPMGDSSPAAQGYSNQDTEENNENASTDQATSAESTPEQATESTAGTEGITPDESGNGFRTTSLDNVMEQPESQQTTSQELLSSFNFSPSEGELPADAFSDTGNPNTYGAGTVEQSTESASRRADIPGEDDGTLIKKQAVTYPYGSFYPGYMMTHGINPFYHYTPINYLQPTQHVMAYPSVYPVAHPGLVSQPLAAERPSHSIHVGAPNVNIDVHTTRGRIAQNPEKQKGSKLKHMMTDFSKKLKLKGKKVHSSERRRKEKRQIPSAFSSPIVNRPMGFSPQQFRYPISNTDSFIGQSGYPSLQQQTQPFNMNTMTRSGLPSMTSPAMETASMGISPLRSPLLRSSWSPSQMAFARQLSSITGISVPISAQPGMGIVGMASRKKRSSSKKRPKRPSKSTKRQFLAGLPQGFTPVGISPFAMQGVPSPFAMQGVPFMGIGLPALPSIRPQQTRPLAFRSRAKPSFPAWKQQRPQPGLSAMRVGSFPRKRIPELAPFNGFPSYPNIPFMNVPQPPNANFFNGGFPAPWSPVAPGGQLASGGQLTPGAAFGGGWEAFPRNFQGNQGVLTLSQDAKQQGAGQPFQMNGEQSAGFNPSEMNFIEQQPTPMFSEDGRAYQTPGQFQSMGSQSETASFFGQMPTQDGLIESNNFNMQSRLTALKKSSVPNKKHNKRKRVKSN